MDWAHRFADYSIFNLGSSAYVYKLSEDTVVKIIRPEKEDSLNEEFRVHKKLFSCGIKVARPFGLISVDYCGTNRKGLLMEFIDGEKPCWLEPNLRKKIEIQRQQEITKCINLGFRVNDAEQRNVIYSEKRGLFLIDFEGWRYENLK